MMTCLQSTHHFPALSMGTDRLGMGFRFVWHLVGRAVPLLWFHLPVINADQYLWGGSLVYILEVMFGTMKAK